MVAGINCEQWHGKGQKDAPQPEGRDEDFFFFKEQITRVMHTHMPAKFTSPIIPASNWSGGGLHTPRLEATIPRAIQSNANGVA